MAKKNQSTPPPAFGKPAGIFHADKAKAAHTTLEAVVREAPSLPELPEWDESAILALGETLPEAQRDQFDDWLKDFAEMGSILRKAINQKEDETKAAIAKWNKAEESRVDCENQRVDLQRQRDEIETRSKTVKEDGAAQAKREAELNAREEKILLREEEAEQGFSRRHQEAIHRLEDGLAPLQAERRRVEEETRQRRLDAEAEIAKLNREAADKRSQLLSEAEQRRVLLENEIRERFAPLEQRQDQIRRDQRALDRQKKELQNERSVMREEIQAEFQAELRNQAEALARWKKNSVHLDKEIREVRERVNLHDDFRAYFPTQSPEEIREKLRSLEGDLAVSRDTLSRSDFGKLEAERDTLRAERDALRQLERKATEELHNTKAQLLRFSLGTLELETARSEKRALEKTKAALDARLESLAKTVDDLTQSNRAETPYPQLAKLEVSETTPPLAYTPMPDLKSFTIDLRHRIAYAEKTTKLYFREEDIRLMVAGLAMSRLHIYQGISGTGKTSLAKAFAKAVGGWCTDIAVQAGWRDRDDLLGHYNAFERKFYEKDCLQALYRAQTPAWENRLNIVLLDEMNLSRPEQYFAEFLSALEKNDQRDRLISLTGNALPNAPKHLRDGRQILVQPNVWFIGTANHDETTNEFADKTYDRAHVMMLPKHEGHFEAKKPSEQATYGYSDLIKAFEDAQKRGESAVAGLLKNLTADTDPVTRELKKFDIGWGNRFERQAQAFIPVYVAAGGSQDNALDHLLATRIFRKGKVTGRFDIQIEDLRILQDEVRKKKWEKSAKLLEEDILRKERGQ